MRSAFQQVCNLIHRVVAGNSLPPLFFFVVVALLGLVFGSFNTVLIARIPDLLSLNGRSKCPSCGQQIKSRDNIPVIGYLLLRGKCRSCKKQISPRYLIVELITAIAVFIPLIKFDRWALIAAWEIFVILGIALSAIDFELHRLPDALTGPMYLLVLVFLTIDALTNHRAHYLNHAFLASIILGAFYWIVNRLSKGGMGLGDAKLATTIGLLTGYISATSVYVASMAGFALGSLVGVGLMIFKKAGRKSALPFGPFMIAGAIVALWITPWVNHLGRVHDLTALVYFGRI